MKNRLGGLWKKARSGLCFLLAAAVALTGMGLSGASVSASGEERTFDIGVNAESVTALLDENGLLTVSGSGAIRDFTAETAPFRDCGITGVKLGGDITAIGDYTFYDCGGIGGVLELPDGLLRLGDRAFSGSSLENAPKPDLVKNGFTEAMVTRKREKAATEPVESSASEPAVEPTEKPSSGSVAEPVESSASEPAAVPSESPSSEPVVEPSEEPSSEPAVEPTEKPEGEYWIEMLTQQEVGEEVFYPGAGEGGAFTCGENNESFRAAMAGAGFQEAQRLIPAVFDPGEGGSSTGDVISRELPLLDGGVALPSSLPELITPDGDALSRYTFCGWTEYRDEADVVRPGGSRFPVSQQEDLYFIASWTREVLVRITAERREGKAVYSVPQPEGYDLLACRWQFCERDPEEDYPDQELLLWQDIPGAEALVYERDPQEGDENRLFRCVLTVQEQQGFSLFSLFSADPGEEIALSGVEGLAATAREITFLQGANSTGESGTISGSMPPQEPGPTGYCTIPEPAYSISGNTVVFNGWKDEDGKVYDPGMIVFVPETGLTLTAQWGVSHTVYVKSVTFSWGGGNGSGTESDPYKQLSAALSSEKLTGDSVYTNTIVLLGDLEDGVFTDRVPDTLTPPAGGVTIKSQGSRTMTTDANGGLKLGGNVRFQSITLKRGTGFLGTQQGDDIYAEGHTLIMGSDVTIDGELAIFGGMKNTTLPENSNPTLIVQGGQYTGIYGGNSEGDSSFASPKVYISGSTTVTYGEGTEAERAPGNTCGGSQKEGSTVRSANLYISGGTFENVYGGTQNGNVSTDSSVVITGEQAVTIKGGLYAGSKGQGAEADQASGSETGRVSGNASLVLDGNVTVTGGVFGGCQNGAVGGNTSVTVYNGSVGGGVFGGGENGAVNGNAAVSVFAGTVETGLYGGGKSADVSGPGKNSLTLSGGTVTGGVYGGGLSGNVSGAVEVTVSGGTVTGSVYGGGEKGDLTGGSSSVSISGGAQVSGSVYGGGMGEAGAENGSVSGDGSVTLSEPCAVGGSVYGGGQNGKLTGNGVVTVSGGSVEGSVYGGGEMGAVGQSTQVTVSGGSVKGAVFGGSMGESASAETGAVAGNTAVSITGGQIGTYTGAASDQLVSGTGSVFGGGQYASVKGNAEVVVEIPNGGSGLPVLGGSAYGGGSLAPVAGVSSLHWISGWTRQSLYGGGFGLASSSGGTQVTVDSGEINGNVYGGGAQGKVLGDTQVVINGGSLGRVFGAGQGDTENYTDIEAGRVSGNTRVVVNGGVMSNVLGGGDMGVVGAGTAIPADPPAEGATAGNTSITLNGGTVDNLFGGGSGSADNTTLGSIFGNTSVTVLGGTVQVNVYGGCNFAYVTGGTTVSLRGEKEKVSVRGSVFGGGNLNRTPDQGYSDVTLVQNGSNVTIDGSGYGISIAGGAFGSGNLTKVGGQMKMGIKNFSGNLTSIQRANEVKVENSSILLTGEDDVTDDQGTKLFSMTLIDQLALYNTTLTLESEARELGSMANCDASWAASAGEAQRSVIRMTPGLSLRLRTSAGFGPASGVFWVEMTEKPAVGVGVRISADETSDIGDGGTTSTGAFLLKASENNLYQDGTALETVSGNIAGSYNYWRFGGSKLEKRATIAAPREEAGGFATVSQTVQLPSSASKTVYRLEKVEKTGSFQLILPQEGESGLSLSLGEGQSSGNTFGLRVSPVLGAGASGWADLETHSADWGAYVLTGLPSGETAWNSGVEGVWRRGGASASYPATSVNGNDVDVELSLVYESSYGAFSGGEVDLTFREYPEGGPFNEAAAENTVVVKLTLEGDSSGVVQSAVVSRGRGFSMPEASESVSVAPSGAVTAGFLTDYYPLAAGAGNIRLNLCSIPGDGASPDGVPRAFPDGTRIVLSDMTSSSGYSYYYYETGTAAGLSNEQSITLSGFTSMSSSGSATYPGPKSDGAQIHEKLLFAVDFSGVTGEALPEGDYFLTLTHSADQQPQEGARAGFSVAVQSAASLEFTQDSGVTTSSVWGVQITPNISPEDTRYADGVSIHLSLAATSGTENKAVSFPDNIEVTGAVGNLLHDRDGSISFTLPREGSTAVAFDFSGVPESMFAAGDYELTAVMKPRAGLQVGSDQASDVAPQTLSFTLTRAPIQERSISVSLDSGSQRLADVSEAGAQLSFTLSYQNIQSGDRLEAVLLHKTGSDPSPASYTPLDTTSGWEVSPGSEDITGKSGGNVAVSVPQGAPSGTYRVRFRILDGSGHTVAEEPYNFIVK